jgi:glutaredoxin 3
LDSHSTQILFFWEAFMSAGPTEGGKADVGSLPDVTIYTSNDCYWCVRAKQYLSQRGVPYVEKNVEINEEYGPDVINLTGQRHVPVIVIGSRAVVGFKRLELEAELDALLGPDETDRRTAEGLETTDPRA